MGACIVMYSIKCNQNFGHTTLDAHFDLLYAGLISRDLRLGVNVNKYSHGRLYANHFCQLNFAYKQTLHISGLKKHIFI